MSTGESRPKTAAARPRASLAAGRAAATPPTRAELLAYLRRPDDGTPGDVYDLALAVALEQQAEHCDTAVYTSSLHLAALRRAARTLLEQGVNLGPTADGPATVATLEQAVDRYEQTARRWGMS